MKDLSNKMIIHQRKDGIEFLQFRRLLEYPEIVHCYTLKANDFNIAGNDTYEEKKDIVDTNYTILAKALQIPKQTILRPYQDHTDVIKSVKMPYNNITIFPKELMKVDGLITNQKHIAFSLSYADCTPIYLYDPVKKVIRKYSFSVGKEH
ncbi:MAG: laccase domain-containing protein [Clostridia bacterium]|nr:laccase domain-containing protein [Clostridia bacterium]